MKKLNHTLLLLFIAFAASGQTITDPVEYNDFFVAYQNDIGNELLKLIGMFDNLPEDRTIVTAQLNKVIAECDNSIAAVKSIKPIANEFNLRSASQDLFVFYKTTMSNDYPLMIDELYNPAPDMENLNAILLKVQDGEAIVDTKFQEAQKQFAAFHKIELEENELQEQFDGE